MDNQMILLVLRFFLNILMRWRLDSYVNKVVEKCGKILNCSSDQKVHAGTTFSALKSKSITLDIVLSNHTKLDVTVTLCFCTYSGKSHLRR